MKYLAICIAALIAIAGVAALAFPGNVTLIGGGSLHSPPASTACLVGSNAASTPANASIAGYTTCLFDMEPANGGFWAAPANYMTNCGASASVANTPSSWHFTLAAAYNSGTTLPCGQSSIVTDGANGTVLNLTGASGTLGASLNWPTPRYQLSQGWLNAGHYDRIVFRIDCNTWYQNGGACSPGNPGGEVILWSSATNTNPWVDDDGWESIVGIGGLSGAGWCSYHGYHTATLNGFLGSAGDYMCYGAGARSPTVDMTNMHTIELLWTNNGAGASSLVLCNWIDGTFTACLNDVPPTGGSLPFTDRSRTFFLAAAAGGATQVNVPNTVNIWVKSWQEWTCSGVATSVCSGSTLYGPDGAGLTYWH